MFDTALTLCQQQNNEWLRVCMLVETILKYMQKLNDVDNDPLYKICIEFWLAFTGKKVEIDSRQKLT